MSLTAASVTETHTQTPRANVLATVRVRTPLMSRLLLARRMHQCVGTEPEVALRSPIEGRR
jgi:hypothetical protein